MPRRLIYLLAVLVSLPLPLSVAADFLSGSEYVASGGSVKAEDFLIFYNAGKLANQGRAVDAYSYRLILSAIRAQLGEPPPDPATPAFKTEWPVYLYSPPMTLVFAALARLPWWIALAVWWLAAVLALLGALGLLRRSLPVLQRVPFWVLVLFAFGFWPLNIVFTNGQNSALTLLVYVLAFYLTQPHYNGRYDWWVGAAAALLGLQKPQLLLGLLLVWVLTGRWRVLAGLVIGGVGACALTLLVLPPATFPAWLGNLLAFSTAAPDAPIPDSDVTVHALLRTVLPFGGAASLLYYVYLAGLLAALALAVRRLAEVPLDETRRHRWLYVLAALFSVVSPNYLLIYDLTLLLLPLLLLFALYDAAERGVPTRLIGLAVFVYLGITVCHFVGLLARVQLAGLVVLAFAGYACLLLYRDMAQARRGLGFTRTD